MGGGEWLTDIHVQRAQSKTAAGKTTFDYYDNLSRQSQALWKVHPTLDPLGIRFRESRDSDDHPESLAIATFFDETGSMGEIPRALQKKLHELNGLLKSKGYVKYPQILFGGIGDKYSDRVPLQVGQFESDNRMDQNLEDIFLEGNGGGQGTESYELAMYFIARHTEIDCWEKRHHKGYMFMIGDEMYHTEVNAQHVEELIGDKLQRDLRTVDITKELKSRYEVFYILPRGASYGGSQTVLGRWRRLLGDEYVLELEDPEGVCETIALQIGIAEGTIDLDAGLKDLADLGVSNITSRAVKKALVNAKALVPRTGSSGLPGLKGDTDPPRTMRL